MIIPIISPDLAAQAPNPEFAWALRPKHEAEPLYTEDKRINLKNYAIRVEYDILIARLGMAGHPVPTDVKRQWEREMIKKYDPLAEIMRGMIQGKGSTG